MIKRGGGMSNYIELNLNAVQNFAIGLVLPFGFAYSYSI